MIIGRKNTGVPFHNFTSGRMQISGPAVIAQSLPHFHQLVFTGFGQRAHIGEPLHKAVIIFQTLSYTGLLQNHLRDPDFVWIGGLSPRQFTTVDLIPLDQYPADFGWFYISDWIGEGHAHTIRSLPDTSIEIRAYLRGYSRSVTSARVKRTRSFGAIFNWRPRIPALI